MSRNKIFRPPSISIPVTVFGVGVVEPHGPGDHGAEWFDHRTRLGRGYKYLPKAAQYALAAARSAVDEGRGGLIDFPLERRGITMGTNNAVSEIQGDIDRTLETHGSHVLSPASAPYFSINLVGSRVAMEYGLKAFSLGYHSPRTAGLEALAGAVDSLARGRADIVVVGAAEAALDESEDVEAEQGAAVLVLGVERPADGLAGSFEPSRAEIGSGAFFLPPAARTDDDVRCELSILGLGAADRVTLVGPDCEVTSSVWSALGEAQTDCELEVVDAAGCLAPLRRVVDVVLAPEAHCVISTSELGSVTAVWCRGLDG